MARHTPVRFGVVGVGLMGHSHCRFIEGIREARLTAVCDIRPGRAREIGERHGVRSFVDYRELIRSRLCDAVILSAPHPVRPPMAIACLKARLHLLSEKPLAETISAADAIVRAARRAPVAFGVMFQRRTEPVLAAAMDAVRRGTIGALTRAALVLPDYRTDSYYRSGDWRATWIGEGGGVLLNQAPHLLDMFVQLAGLPTTVVGRVQTRLHKIAVEDVADAMLTYANGASGYLYASTCEPRPGEMIELAGDRGKLIYRDGTLQLLSYREPVRAYTRRTEKLFDPPPMREVRVRIPDRPFGHAVIIRNFARHIQRGEPLIAPGADGLGSLELANAIVLSSHTGQPVRLPVKRRAYDAFLATMRRAEARRR